MQIKTILYITLISLLLTPSVLGVFNYSLCKELGGVVPPEPDNVEINFTNFFSGEIQKYTTKVLKKNIGLRNFFIRTFNQINYSLFNKTKSIIVLSDGSFIFYDYIVSFYGNDYGGINKINKYTDELLYVQNKLRKQNKNIILVLAPNKAYFEQKYIQKQYKQHINDSTNYDVLTKVLNDKNINFIDFQDYFYRKKDSLKYPVFPKYGIHWSGYTSVIAADSLFSYIYTSLNYNYTRFSINKGEETTTNYKFTDNDLEELANLLFSTKGDEVYYPKIKFANNSKKPNALLIGDSFTQSFFGFYPFLDSILNTNSAYWYYGGHVGWPKKYEDNNVNNLDFYDQIKDRDVFVIVETIANIDSYFTDDFVNLLYSYLKFDEIKYDFSLGKLEYNIKQDSVYYTSIKQKAIANNMSTKEQLLLDIIWMFKQNSVYKKVLDRTIKQIKNNKDLYNSIKHKAKNNGFKEESQLVFDAQWIIENEFKVNN